MANKATHVLRIIDDVNNRDVVRNVSLRPSIEASLLYHEFRDWLNHELPELLGPSWERLDLRIQFHPIDPEAWHAAITENALKHNPELKVQILEAEVERLKHELEHAKVQRKP